MKLWISSINRYPWWKRESDFEDVIGPGCQIPPQANLDNIRAFTMAGHEYGAF